MGTRVDGHVRLPARHLLLAGVEQPRVEPRPRDEVDVVPGGCEPVGQLGGVRGHPALERVRGTDHGHPHRYTPSRDRTTRSESSASDAIITPVTTSSTVLAGK